MDVLRWRGAAVGLLMAVAMTARAGVTVTPIGDSPADDGTGTATSTPTAGATAPTAEEAQGLADAGQYKDALKVLLRLLDMRGAAVTFDRQQMLILRAECQLQIHQNAAALTSLEQARAEAAAAGSEDDAAQAAAMSYLIQKSPRYMYSPLTGPDRKPINILDKGNRKAAYAALFADAFAAIQQRLQAAMSSNTLPPMIEVAKELMYVRALEKVSSVGTAQSDGLMKDASRAATRLVSSTLTDMEAKVNRISAAANQVINQNGFGASYNSQSHHAGLTSDEIQTLKDIGATCEKFPEVLADFGKAFGNADLFQNDARRIDSLKDRVEQVLTKDYRAP